VYTWQKMSTSSNRDDIIFLAYFFEAAWNFQKTLTKLSKNFDKTFKKLWQNFPPKPFPPTFWGGVKLFKNCPRHRSQKLSQQLSTSSIAKTFTTTVHVINFEAAWNFLKTPAKTVPAKPFLRRPAGWSRETFSKARGMGANLFLNARKGCAEGCAMGARKFVTLARDGCANLFGKVA